MTGVEGVSRQICVADSEVGDPGADNSDGIRYLHRKPGQPALITHINDYPPRHQTHCLPHTALPARGINGHTSNGKICSVFSCTIKFT